MNIVMPIILLAVALGMFRPRIGKYELYALIAWIIVVLARYWIKGPL